MVVNNFSAQKKSQNLAGYSEVCSGNTGIQFTIKKIDTSASTVTISGTIDGESDPQLTEQNSYITIISNGNAWYKVAEYVSAETSTENQTYIVIP